ncbi:MAG: nucleotidyltransferase [Candidatus Aminicenantes bacterium]|nr:nucleotidyltransferase [Acidobacteriota bacterium]MCG2812695.1 nucleotidyltransferase [Candidatus Aminicenantes bacterium]
MNKAGLLRILKIFHRLEIPFALVGGHAVAAWGAVRATRDIDFLAAVLPDQIIELVNKFKKAGFKVDYRKGDEGDPVQGVIGLESMKAEDAEPVEIILGIKKMPTGIFERARQILFLGMEVPVTSPEDLIVLKCLAAGPVDLEDARTIFKIMNKKMDMEYLKSEFKRCRLSLEKLTK